MEDKNSGEITKKVNEKIGDGIVSSVFPMYNPGRLIESLDLTIDMDSNFNLFNIELAPPSMDNKSIIIKDDLNKFRGQAVNGFWKLLIEPKGNLSNKRYKKATETILKSWTLIIEETTVDKPLKDFGIVNTIVGNGTWENKKDSVPGQNALESMGGRSWGVCLSPDGVVYYNSFDQGFIAYINDQNKSIPIYSGISMPMVMDFYKNGDLYVAAYGDNEIVKIEKGGFKVEKLLKDQIYKPTACRFGKYNKDILYICDSGNHRITSYNVKTGEKDIVVGISGAQGFEGDGEYYRDARLNYPIDIDVNEHNVMVIADGLNNRIRAANLSEDLQYICGVSLKPLTIETIAGSAPIHMGDDPFDTLKVFGNCVCDLLSGTCETDCDADFEDGFRALDATIYWPFSPRVDSRGRLWFFDADNHKLRMITSSGLIYNMGGNSEERGFRTIGAPLIALERNPPIYVPQIGDGGSPLKADFNRVMDIEIVEYEEGKFDIYLGDTDNCVVRKISGIEFKNTYRDPDRYTDLRFVELRDPKIINGKLGFETILKNFGNTPAPGGLAGNLMVQYSLWNDRQCISALDCNVEGSGIKGPVYMTTMRDKIWTKNSNERIDDGFRFPYTENYTYTLQGFVDIYGQGINAVLDVNDVKDGVYEYKAQLDPYGYYFFQDDIPEPFYLEVELKGGKIISYKEK